jgi:hypothetical protein
MFSASENKNNEKPKLNAFFKASKAPIEIEKKTSKKRKISLRKETVLSAHQSTNKTKTSKAEEFSNNNTESSSVNIHKESLILFDEIDVVFREDVGFWAAINHFIKRSKKPIILTTNDEFLQEKINLNVEKIEFIRPRIDASIRFLKSVALKEQNDLDTHIAYNIIRDCKCDMRRALVQLQLLTQNISKALILVILLNYLFCY